jgi:putative membrane-bound dehydrogenase-like protein
MIFEMNGIFKTRAAIRLLLIVATVSIVHTIEIVTAAADFPRPLNTDPSTDHPMNPGDVCKTVALPAGFQLTTFASEPDVQNPIAIATDDRGRIWVAENYTWAGADAGNWDSRLKDRIVILEDSNGDGKSDRRTVFYDQAVRLTSVQVGMGGAWILCPPQLVFIPDKNRDDIPDGPPVVVLDGFDISNSSHTVANGLKWGPDGWLYGRQGILGTSKIGVPGTDDAHRVKINTGVWRYDPVHHKVEAVMHGMTNPWGFDYDAYGECFVTNTVIGHMWHVIPGARTERMSGTDFNPYAYQLISQVADHVHWNSREVWNDVRKGVTDKTSAAGGGHAHTGLMIYQGDNWPAEYRGRAFTLNYHGRRINCDILARRPVGYVAHHGADMCFVADPWFRGTELISGADGGVFISDWSDTGECHEMGGVHRTSGRIYKLNFGKPQTRRTPDLVHATDQKLVQLQLEQNDWVTRRARLQLQERSADGTLDTTTCREILLNTFEHNTDPVIRLRAMWALQLTGNVEDDWLRKQLDHADEHVRVWAIRLLMDRYSFDDNASWTSITDKFQSLARHDSSGLVLLYLASALQKMPIQLRWPIVESLATRTENAFNEDRTLSIMLWLGTEPASAQDVAASIRLLRETTYNLLRENIARRLASDIDSDVQPVEQLLTVAASEASLRADILRGIAASLNGRNKVPVPSNWRTTSIKFAADTSHDISESISIIGVAFRDNHTIDILRSIVQNPHAKPASRNRSIQLLLTTHPKEFNKILRPLVADPQLASEAIRGLAAYDDPDAATEILGIYNQLTPEQRETAINTLCSRATYAKVLVQALESKKLPSSDIAPFHLRQLMALRDASISERTRAIWGDVRQTSSEKRHMINRLRAILIPTLAQADLQNGKAIFSRSCASCHILFGQGAKIGPDLTGSNRKNLDYLLENIVDPSAIVGPEFRVSVFTLSDGRIVSGIICERSDKTVTIQNPDGRQIIDRDAIDEMSVSDKSLMPDGLLQTFSNIQIRDLIAYLMSN